MERIKFILGSLFGTLTFVPALVLAQSNLSAQGGLASFLSWLQSLMAMVVPILIGLAVIVFLFGVLRFIFSASDPEKRKEGRSYMIWAIIGIVVMVSVWGLVIFVQNSFGLGSNGGHPAYPTI